MNKYKKGYRLERACVLAMRKQGFEATGSRGSHSLFDVWAVEPHTLKAVYIQCKNKKMTQAEINREIQKIRDAGFKSKGRNKLFFLAHKGGWERI